MREVHFVLRRRRNISGNAVIPCPYGLVKCQKKEQQRKKGQWGEGGARVAA